MEFISKCTADTISNAAQALIDGHLVAFPTETVYGLGADATNEKAVSRIYSVKGRPTDHPLIVHISSINKLVDWSTDIPDYAIKLAREFWPGPMTLILPRKEMAKNFITGVQNNVGLRVPDHPIALALLKKFEEFGGQGIAAPSANRFGAVSPTTAAAVDEELGDYLDSKDLILDGGTCFVGIESTIIDCTKTIPTLLRPGIITENMVKNATGLKLNFRANSRLKYSGKSKAHYSPKTPVEIGTIARKGDGLIALSSVETPKDVIRLAAPENLKAFARELYGSLRKGDELALRKIVIIPPKGNGISKAIRNRIKRSAQNKETF